MTIRATLSLAIALLAPLALASGAQAVTFDDGLVHVIDAGNSFPFEGVEVLDGPGGAPTTVQIITGGVIGTGQPNSLGVHHHSIVEMSGGMIGHRIQLNDASFLNFSGGTVVDSINVGGTATIAQISGGSAERIVVAGGIANVSGGSFVGNAPNQDFSLVANNAVLNVSGGNHIELRATDDATLNISGGNIASSIIALRDSFANIFGTGFNLPFGEVVAFEGALTGNLSDGTPLNVDFGRATTATITLAATTDTDDDGIADGLDNCFDVPNEGQEDTDENGLGDACNDAEDFDGDEYADDLDNCPDDPNVDQADADSDLIGDVCDPFPDNPNNDLAQCEDDLAACEASLPFVDSDGDGEEDSTDACAGTLVGAAVDQAGCSLEQFCTSIDTSTKIGERICRSSDWRNDEALTNPGDCALLRQGRGQPPLCVPG